MLIDKYIGTDAKGVTGIDGSQFASEVLALKNSGVTDVEVWINSKGGNVSDGFSIYGTLKNSGLNVTTVNMGLVDSTAGWVYQAGNKRVWMNYGLGLIHDVQGAKEYSEVANNSIATMLSGRTNKTVEDVRGLMSANTMLGAQDAKEYGFCDEVRNCTDVYSFTNSSDINEVTQFGDIQINKLPKLKIMSTLNSILDLQNEASEAAQVEAINGIINARNEADNKVTALTAELTNTSNLLTTTQTELNTAKATILEATNASNKIKAEALIAEHKGKRISDTPEAIAMWTNAATTNYEGTKAMIESIPLNVTAPIANATNASKGKGYFSADAGTIMLEKSMAADDKRKGKK